MEEKEGTTKVSLCHHVLHGDMGEVFQLWP